MWHAFYDRVMSEGHNFVVIDNLAQTLNGSVNDDAVVRQFFDGVRLFVPAGIPVVIVAHSSDKAGVNGYKPETPMGSAYISQAVRWRIFARRSRKGNMTLRFMGNHAEPYEMTLYHGGGRAVRRVGRGAEGQRRRPAAQQWAVRPRGQRLRTVPYRIGPWCRSGAVQKAPRRMGQRRGGAQGIQPRQGCRQRRVHRWPLEGSGAKPQVRVGQPLSH
jgi:hypothetical protein